MNLTSYSGVNFFFFRNYFKSKKEFTELFLESKNYSRSKANIEDLKQRPKRGYPLPRPKYVTAFLRTVYFWTDVKTHFSLENRISATSMNAFEVKENFSVIKRQKLSFLSL